MKKTRISDTRVATEISDLEMADDREVLREVWDGRIPAVFTLSSQEVETLTAPDPYYLMLPRQSCLPIVTEKVRRSEFHSLIGYY